jgi:cell division ATPase FtsA
MTKDNYKTQVLNWILDTREMPQKQIERVIEALEEEILFELATKIRHSEKTSAKTTVTPKKFKKVATTQKITGKQAKVVVEERDTFQEVKHMLKQAGASALVIKKTSVQKTASWGTVEGLCEVIKHRFDQLKFNNYIQVSFLLLGIISCS